MIDRDTVNLVLSRADIQDVVGEYVALTRRGANLVGLCPFHSERTPSFSVSPSRGIYKCFGCGKGGNALNFIMEIEHLNFVEAVRFLAKKVGIEIEERPQTPEDIQAQEEEMRLHKLTEWAQNYFHKELLESEKGQLIGLSYFKHRGVNEETLKRFVLGYCPDDGAKMTEAALAAGFAIEDLVKVGITVARENWRTDRFKGRVIFPIHSVSGRPIAFGGRTMKTDEQTAKYVNSPENPIYHKSNELFALAFSRRAISQKDNCILVEGYMDVLSMWQRGVNNIVASSGTSLTVEQVRLIRRFTKNVTVLYDGDSAGIKAAERGSGILLEEGMTVRIVLLPEGQDPDDFARAHTLEEIEQYIAAHTQDFIRFITAQAVGASRSDPSSMVKIAEAVLAKIALIPDALLRAFYIREASEEFKLGEQVLADTVNELRLKRTSQLRKEAEREIRSTEHEEKAQASVETQPMLSEYEQRLSVSERELIEVLLRYGTEVIAEETDEATGEVLPSVSVAQYFFDELEQDQIELSNERYRTIFEEYRDEYKNNPSGNFIEHFTKHPSPEISALSVDLVVDKYVQSRRWTEDVPEGFDVVLRRAYIGKLAERVLLVYKSRLLMLQLSDLQERLRVSEDAEEQIDLLKQISENNDLRRLLAEHLRRIKL